MTPIKRSLIDRGIHYCLLSVIPGAVERLLLVTPRFLLRWLANRLYPRLESDSSYRISMNMQPDAVYQYVNRAINDLNRDYVAGFIRSAFLCDGIFRPYLRKRAAARYGVRIPQVIAFSVLNACNLRRVGCYAAEHAETAILPLEIIRTRIIGDANALGTGLFVVLGGEPLLYPEIVDIVRNRSSLFGIYTNGYFLDDAKADFFAQSGNVVIFFGVGGYGKSTDEQRGKGTFEIVRRKMQMLKDRGAPFGLSILVTSRNWEEVSSKQFIDDAIGWGAFNVSYFLYGPLGRRARMELMLSAGDRASFNERVDALQREAPLGILNEMNHTCWAAAGNWGMLHVTACGDIEPCFAIHYSADNIYRASLLDALQSRLFTDIQKEAYELDRGCIMRDRTGSVLSVCSAAGATPTQPKAQSQYEHLAQLQTSAEGKGEIQSHEGGAAAGGHF